MQTIDQTIPATSSVSRRTFLKTTGTGLSFALLFGPMGVQAACSQQTHRFRESALGAWVKIDTDGNILIYNPSSEMGQGSKTAVPVILAEEMDADWSKVRIENSPIEPDLYGLGRNMGTYGSRTIRGYFQSLRRVGGQIRKVMLENVAREWNVPVSELTTEPSTVVHASSGRRISYGEIAAFAVIPDELPAISDSELKSPADFRLIGHSVPRVDIPAKTDGSARYAIDVKVPDMLYGMITRSPVHNGSPASYNADEVEALPGVTATVRLDHGIGILGESITTVMNARKVLKVEWAQGAPSENFDSVQTLRDYAEIPGSGQIQPRSVAQQGDSQTALQNAVKRYESDYLSDHVYHAQMEPLNAVVSVNQAGDAAEVWVGTQTPWGFRNAVAGVLNVSTDRVTLHPHYLGGGFGRRSNSDYVEEATHLSNAVKRPVKLIWSREDDLQYGQFRPMCLQRLSAGVDAQGRVTAWTHCVVGDGGGLLTSGAQIPFYNIPNHDIELCSFPTGVRLKHWRAVGHGFNKFAIEAFLDEIATDQGIDPYEFRRTLMRDAPRALKVLDTVAEMADWGGPVPEGRARGIAFAERSGSLGAGVAEISVDEATGKIRVHRFWTAVDGGIIVQLDNATAQVEGGVVTGISSVLFESITFKDGKVEQSNFNNYNMMRMSDMPEVEVQFIQSYEEPTGLGESGTPLVGGAVANAFAALTGKRLRHLPFSQERVRAVLQG